MPVFLQREVRVKSQAPQPFFKNSEESICDIPIL